MSNTAYLELTRTLEVLAFIGGFMGMMGHTFFPPPGQVRQTCKYQLNARLQEISYFLAGVLVMLAVVCYGMNYHNHYSEDEDRFNVHLGGGFYISSVSSGLFILFSIVIGCCRDTGIVENFKRKMRAKDLKKQTPKKIIDSDKRNVWLKNKKVPTPGPSAQKEKEADEANDLAVVKESALKKIITTSNVVLAFNRIKNGVRRKEERETLDREEREIEYLKWKEASKLEDAENKYKGIFTVEGEAEKKPTLSPLSTGRMSSNATPTPRSVRIVAHTDTTSTSSFTTSESLDITTSSEDLMVTAKDGAILPSANAAAAAVEDSLPPRNLNQNGTVVLETTTPQRHRVRRSVTTLRENAGSRNWSVDHTAETKPNKLKPKRHYSHDPTRTKRKLSKSKDKSSTALSSKVPGKSIYGLPVDGAHPNHLPPPQYEEVIGSHGHPTAPQPVMTEQSRKYQPYS